MQLKKLNTSFYTGNPIVQNALDYYALDSKWDTTKERGHGVVKITINDLTFAIPVRSHVTHNASLILEVNRKNFPLKYKQYYSDLEFLLL